MSETANKRSYTVPCSSGFRDAVAELAARRGVNAADLARSVTLLVPGEDVARFPDPGGPDARDRETVTLKSGASKGRPWRRKPRLQVRMQHGLSPEFIRRALAMALAIDRGECDVRVDGAGAAVPAPQDPGLNEELERLRTLVSVLSFDPLPDGVGGRDDALHVLGLPPGRIPDQNTIRARYRMLATIYHPDGVYGNHSRMAQLNQAVSILRRAG